MIQGYKHLRPHQWKCHLLLYKLVSIIQCKHGKYNSSQNNLSYQGSWFAIILETIQSTTSSRPALIRYIRQFPHLAEIRLVKSFGSSHSITKSRTALVVGVLTFVKHVPISAWLQWTSLPSHFLLVTWCQRQ